MTTHEYMYLYMHYLNISLAKCEYIGETQRETLRETFKTKLKVLAFAHLLTLNFRKL